MDPCKSAEGDFNWILGDKDRRETTQHSRDPRRVTGDVLLRFHVFTLQWREADVTAGSASKRQTLLSVNIILLVENPTARNRFMYKTI